MVVASLVGAATVASLSSGALITVAGYAVLCLVGAALVVVPALVVARFGPSAARLIREGLPGQGDGSAAGSGYPATSGGASPASDRCPGDTRTGHGRVLR